MLTLNEQSLNIVLALNPDKVAPPEREAVLFSN